MLTAITFIYINSRYVQFFEIYFLNDTYIISQNKPSGKFYSNLKSVLRYYKEDFLEKDSVIYVKSKLFADRELMYNYTKKAKDSVWLSSR